MSLRPLSLVLILVAGAQASAHECPLPSGATAAGIAHRDSSQRLAFLSAVAAKEASHIGTWKLLAGGTFSVLVAGQLVIAPLVPPETRPDYYWGAAYSLLGAVSTLLPPPAVFDRGAAYSNEAAAATPEQRCGLIAEGERLLRAGAADESLTGRWFVHAANVAVNISLGLILGLGYGHWTTGTINTLVGITLSEAILFTKPSALVAAWRDYTEGGARGISWQPQLAPIAGGGLVGISGRF